MDNFKNNLLNVSFFLHPQIPDFQIVVSRPNIVLSNHTSIFNKLSDDVYISYISINSLVFYG